jgi:hypothetical protein
MGGLSGNKRDTFSGSVIMPSTYTYPHTLHGTDASTDVKDVNISIIIVADVKAILLPFIMNSPIFCQGN